MILVFMFLAIEDRGMACKRLREYSATWNGMWDTQNSFLNEQWRRGENELWRTWEEENESEENSGVIIDAMITSYAPLILVFMFLAIEDRGMACESWSGSGTMCNGYRERDSVVVRVQRTSIRFTYRERDYVWVSLSR